MRSMLRLGTVSGLLLLGLVLPAFAADLSESELSRKAMNDAADVRKLRKKSEFVRDQSPAFVRAPASPAPAGDYDVAKFPPTVMLQILPDLNPEYFTGAAQYMACWANWAYVTRSADNRFFCAASNHLGRGASINVYEYAPPANKVRKVLDVAGLLGWASDSYTDGKIHGHMGIMADGTLWGATHEGVHPDEQWYAAGFRGSWLFSHNLRSGKSRNWGVPLAGASLPCHTLDEKRGRLVMASSGGQIVCWDTLAHKVTHAGYPPRGWLWWPRAMLCDRSTGTFWGMDNSEAPHRFMSYDPQINRFVRFETSVPENPFVAGAGPLRGHTPDPAMDGYFYWATINGALFRFRPEGTNEPVVEPVGVTWDKGRDTLQMAMEPKGRYIYYYPKGDPAPIVQFDVKTGRRKALCWLQDYYFQKYGYWMDHVYGMEVSNDGSFLVVCTNGTFTADRGNAFGHPALLVVHVPEQERPQ